MENILTDADLEKKINTPVMLVLVDFFATWCEPCSLLSPILTKTSENFTGRVLFVKADVDNVPMTAQKYGVEKIPTIALFRNGKQINGFVGLMPEKAINEWLENIIKGN